MIGDSNEEKRMKPVLEEKKKATINGKLDRLTKEEIETRERALSIGSDGQPKRRGSANRAFTPSGSKVNPKLRKALMMEEQEKIERAARAQDDERKREAHNWAK